MESFLTNTSRVNVIRLPMGLRVRTRRVATDTHYGRIAYRHID